ncbi:MAG: hypothetical protein K1X92_12945 [Bacteroidia bacterium]|nr:hypothetical protein [Bacteroidia bacterium]
MITTALRYGFSTGLRQWKIVLIVYSIQLGLALTLGLQVMNVLESSIGNSLEVRKLLLNYDHTVFSDFIKVHGASLSPLIGQLRWLVLIYMLFAVFIDGGLLYTSLKPENNKPEFFWRGGAEYFFPFLKISFFFLLLALGLGLLLFIPAISLFQPALSFFPNEKYAIRGFFLLLVFYLLLLSLLFVWSVFSRQWKIRTGSPLLTCIKKGFELLRKNGFRILGIILFLGGIHLLSIFLYWILSETTGGSASFLVLVFSVLIQQFFIFFRISLRMIFYSGLSYISNPH